MPTPKVVSQQAVLKIHARQVERFGGTPGLRDEGLLESAFAQPQATFGGQMLHSTIPEQAAAYLYHLAMNHPLIDGNKRTAFAVMDTFLRANGYRLEITDDKAYNLVMRAVQGELDKISLAQALSMAIK